VCSCGRTPPPSPHTHSFRERGFYLDGAAIASSALLLVLLLALTFQRILGLDRLINAAIE
jgi:hypothetical protein